MNDAHNFLRGLQILATLCTVNAYAQPLSPYPDVWEMQFPNPAPGSSLHATLLNDGQVVVAYMPEGMAAKAPHVEKLFFGGGNVKREKLPDGQLVYTYADGTHAIVARYASYREQLADGRVIRSADNKYRDCYRGPAQEYVVISDDERRQRIEKVFFYLLDEPKHFVSTANDSSRGLDAGPLCPTEPSLNLELSVESISGSFLPLPDGTILLLDHQHGLVLRLTKDLDSRSKLMNRRVFAFPYNGSYLFVGRLLGKDYGSGEEQSIRYQEALDDFSEHLRKIRDDQVEKQMPNVIGVRATNAASDSCVRNDHGIFEDINCAVKARDAADRELNQVYKALLEKLRPSEEKLLRQAQRDWLEFIEADAKFTFGREGDGSSGRVIAVNYRERLTRERVSALKSWLP